MMSGAGVILPPGLCRRPVHLGMAAAIETGNPVPGPPPGVGQGREDHRSAVVWAVRLLVHEMIIGHDQQRDLIPRQRDLLRERYTRLPPTPLAHQREELD